MTMKLAFLYIPDKGFSLPIYDTKRGVYPYDDLPSAGIPASPQRTRLTTLGMICSDGPSWRVLKYIVSGMHVF
jgi:hypothetical protein